MAPENDKADAAGTLVYSVRTMGTATVHRIVYEGSSGPVTLDAPTIPFQQSLQVSAGAKLHIQAIGTTESGGSIVASYVLNVAGGAAGTPQEATCAH